MGLISLFHGPLAVIPILVGPLQTLLAILPGIALALLAALVSLAKPSVMKKLLLLLWSQKLAVGVFAALVAAGIYAWPRVFSSRPAGAVAAVEQGNATWTLWRGGLARRGAALDAPDPTAGAVNGAFAPRGKAFYSSPAVVGNRLYATSAEYGAFKDEGRIHCLDADTRQLVWEFQADGYRSTFSSPAIDGKYLCVGEGLHYINNGRLFCLDREASEQQRRGVKLWEFATKNHVESSPCIADGKVVVGAGSDGLYCFALVPLPGGQPNLLWHLDPKQYPDCEASPVIDAGRVYFSLGNDGQAICCVELASGAPVWRVDTPHTVFGSPAIDGGRLYVGMGSGDFVKRAEELGLKPAGEVWCIDLASHEVLWKFHTDRTVLGAVAVADGKVYFGADDQHVYCLATDGQLLHKWDAHAPITASVAVGRQHVYAVTRSGQLYGLDRNTLEKVWDVELGSEVFSSPCVARGQLYVGSNSAGLLSVGRAGEASDVAHGLDVYQAGLNGPLSPSQTRSSASERGQFAWRFPRPDPNAAIDDDDKAANVVAPRIASLPGYRDGACYLPIADGARGGVVKLQLQHDAASSQPLTKWFAACEYPPNEPPQADATCVYFVDGADASQRWLHAVDVATGKQIGRQPIAPGASGRMLLAGDQLLIADAAQALACRKADATLALEWSSSIGTLAGTPIVVGDVIYAAVAGDGQANKHAMIVALDRHTGFALWRQPLESSPVGGPVYCGSRLWLATADAIRSFDPIDGQQTESVVFSASDSLVTNGKLLAAYRNQAARGLILIDGVTGQLHVRLDGIAGVGAPLLVGESVYVADAETNAIEVFELPLGDGAAEANAVGKSRRTWFHADWIGQWKHGLLMIDGEIYAPTDRLGLVKLRPRPASHYYNTWRMLPKASVQSSDCGPSIGQGVTAARTNASSRNSRLLVTITQSARLMLRAGSAAERIQTAWR